MKPPRFEYVLAHTVGEALDALRDTSVATKVLAGGQSLVPLLSMRLAHPDRLVDLNKLTELDYVRDDGDGVLRIGALTRQRTLERSPIISHNLALLATAMPYVGHFAIRNRGTLGGSLCHADPASELPAVMRAYDAIMVTSGPRGVRRIPAERFFVGPLMTDLQPDELLVEVEVPQPPASTTSVVKEVARRHGDFAIVGIAATAAVDSHGLLRYVRLVAFGVGGVPERLAPAEEQLENARAEPKALEAAGVLAAQHVDPGSDIHASAGYRRRLTGILVTRALTDIARRSMRSSVGYP